MKMASRGPVFPDSAALIVLMQDRWRCAAMLPTAQNRETEAAVSTVSLACSC